jgi:GH25 family lysozyme M1 (1,4-beta-N-acetylmuramidase)
LCTPAAASETPPAFGVDLSHYNFVTSPAAVRAAGISFAYLKVTEGTTYVDPTLGLHAGELAGVHIVVGGYHYADVGPSCAAQARWFRSHLTAAGLLRTGDLVPALDLEASGLAHTADACVRAFYDTLGAGELVVYSSASWWSTWLHTATWGDRHIVGWVARYNGDPGRPDVAGLPALVAIHQHSSHGLVPGVAGDVDRDAIIPGHTLARTVSEAPGLLSPPPPTPPATVHTVRAGDTLSALALLWHTTVAAIAARNGIPNPNRIFVGERITRPTSAIRVYVVQRGDTLSGIAARMHVPGGWPVLARLNHLAAPGRILPGQRLVLV